MLLVKSKYAVKLPNLQLKLDLEIALSLDVFFVFNIGSTDGSWNLKNHLKEER